MKTAVQQIYDFLNEAEQNNVFEVGTQNLKRYIETIYLETEKQQIIEAVKFTEHTSGYSGEEYYNYTFTDFTNEIQ